MSRGGRFVRSRIVPAASLSQRTVRSSACAATDFPPRTRLASALPIREYGSTDLVDCYEWIDESRLRICPHDPESAAVRGATTRTDPDLLLSADVGDSPSPPHMRCNSSLDRANLRMAASGFAHNGARAWKSESSGHCHVEKASRDESNDVAPSMTSRIEG